MEERQQNAACPRLWDSAFVGMDGQVYACCHYLPHAIGNIHDAPLEQIRHGNTATNMRRAALSSGTGCFSSCSILTETEKQAALRLDSVEPKRLERMHILFGEGCKLACVMCNQDHSNAEMLDADLVLRNAVPETGTAIEIQGGEPLQLKESRKYLATIIERGWAPTIITNGLQLTGQLGESALQGCSRVKISLNAATQATHEAVNRGSSWARVIGNVRKAVQLKASRPRTARLIGRMTLVPLNLREAAAFIWLCVDLGLEGVEYGYDSRSVPAALANDPFAREALKEEIRAAHAACSDRIYIQTHRLAGLGLWTAA